MGFVVLDWWAGKWQEGVRTASEWTESKVRCDWETRSRTANYRRKKTCWGNSILKTDQSTVEGMSLSMSRHSIRPDYGQITPPPKCLIFPVRYIKCFIGFIYKHDESIVFQFLWVTWFAGAGALAMGIDVDAWRCKFFIRNGRRLVESDGPFHLWTVLLLC